MKKKRLGKHLVAAGLATLLVTTGLAVSAQGEELTKSSATSRFLNGSIGGQDLASIAELRGTTAANPGNVGPNTNPLQLSVLQTINVGQPVSIPLAGFLSPSQGSLGVANHYAAAPSRTKALSASGAVRDSGGVLTTDPTSFPASGKVSFVGGPLAAVDDLTGASLTVGALSGSSQVDGDTVTRDYQIAGLSLNLDIPALAAALDALTDAVGDVSANDLTINPSTLCDAVSDPINVTVADLLTDLSGNASTDLLGELNLLLGGQVLDLCMPPAPLDTLLTDDVLGDLVEVKINGVGDVLKGVGTLTGGGVSIDLAKGTVSVDLAAVLKAAGKDLNDLPPNTDILKFLATNLNDTITNLLKSLTDDVIAKAGALTVSVSVDGNVVLDNVGVTALTDAGATDLSDSLQDLLDDLNTALDPILGELDGPLGDLVDTLGQVIRLTGNNQSSSTSSRITTAGAFLDPTTSASVGRFYQQSALRIDVLNGDAASVELAAAEAGLEPDTVVTTNDDGTPAPPTTTTGSDDGGVTTTLPNTGAPNVLPFFVLGLLLVAAGASTIVTERRREAAAALLA